MCMFQAKLKNEKTRCLLIWMLTGPQIFLWNKIFKPIDPKCNDVKYFKQPHVLNNW